MEQPFAERPFSQEQHANRPQSWHNGTMDNRGTQLLQDSSGSGDPRKWAVWNRTNMSNGSFNGEDLRDDTGRASICRDHIRGRCARGLSCKFQHSDFVHHGGTRFSRNDQRILGPSEDSRTSQLPFKKRNLHLFSENEDGDSRRSFMGEGRSRSPCRNFQIGRCFRGSSCPRLHMEFGNYNGANVDESRRFPFRDGRERSLCRNYQSGRCYLGSSCPYLHPKTSEAEQQHAVITASRNPMFHNGNVDNPVPTSQENNVVVTASTNSRFHEANVDNNLKTSQIHDAANNENNSIVSFSRQPQSKSPCRNFLQGRCQFGASCRRWHPDNAFHPRVSAVSPRMHHEPHQPINLRTELFSGEPRNGPSCQFFQRGSCYQGEPSSNMHPGSVYERSRYDSGERYHQGVRAISRDSNFDRGNGVREINYPAVRPYHDAHSYNRESVNVAPRSWSSERKRSRPENDFCGNQQLPEVCLKFTKGRCDQGGNCRYLHSFHEYASENDFGGNQQLPEVCLKFTKGRCDLGGNCRYLHSFHEYASSSSQQSQKPLPEAGRQSMNVGQANQGAEGNENVCLWSPPFKRQKIWSRSSFSPENNLHNRTLRRDCSFGNYHSDRSRPNHEALNQYPDRHPFKFYGAANHMNKLQHLNVASTSVNPSLRVDTDSVMMPQDGNGELVTCGITVEIPKEATAVFEANMAPVALENPEMAGLKADTNHELKEKTEETVYSLKTYSRKMRVKQHPETDDIGDVQGNEVVTIKANTDNDILLGDSDVLQASQSSDTAILKSRRKLLVLDVNGIIADIVADFPDRYKPDITVAGKGVFKRPFCDEFLQFCFEKFDVGIWSSRTQKNVTRVLDCLMENTKNKLLFCWHQSHCTETGYNTVENKEKPLVLKELKKLWNKEENDLPWKKGFYDETNTILLDDSPYKALRNPPYTAIFPFPYSFKKVNDNSLGPDGDLRLHLGRLAEAENVQKFIQENPFGQRPITKANLSWTFYSKIVGDHAMQQEVISRSTLGSS